MTNYIEKPWGYEQVLSSRYVDIDDEDPVIVKNLVLFESHGTSLQYHVKRSEIWKVLSGKCRIQVGDSINTAFPGTVWEIPRLVKHRITAITDTVIEETSDKYDEKDITRLEDPYGR